MFVECTWGDVEALNWLLHYCKCFVGSWNVLNPLCKALYSYNCIDRGPIGNIWDMQQPMFKYAVPAFCRFSCVIYFLYTVQPLFRAIPLSGKKFLHLWFMVRLQRTSLEGLQQRAFRWTYQKMGPANVGRGRTLGMSLQYGCPSCCPRYTCKFSLLWFSIMKPCLYDTMFWNHFTS